MQLETNVLELRQAHAERQKSWEETLTLREMELAQARVREEEVVLKLICRVPIKKMFFTHTQHATESCAVQIDCTGVL